MAKRRVEYVLDAEDRASPLIQKSSQKMERQLRGTSKRVESSFKRMTSSAQQFAGAVGLGGVGLAAGAALAVRTLRVQFRELDALAKQAQGIGVATDQLQLMRFAGEQTGNEINALDKSIERFTRRLGQATEGEGEARKGLAELQVEAHQLLRLPLAEQMLEIADAMERRGLTASDRLRVSYSLFGREGQKLGNTLLSTRKELEALIEERREIGGLFTDEDVDKVERANDAMNRLSTAISGMAGEIAIEFSDETAETARIIAEIALGTTGREGRGTQTQQEAANFGRRAARRGPGGRIQPSAVFRPRFAREFGLTTASGERGATELLQRGVTTADEARRTANRARAAALVDEALTALESKPRTPSPVLPPGLRTQLQAQELTRVGGQLGGLFGEGAKALDGAQKQAADFLRQRLGVGSPFGAEGEGLLGTLSRLAGQGLGAATGAVGDVFAAPPGADPRAAIPRPPVPPSVAAGIEAERLGGLRAVESRFLTRGREAVDPQKSTAKNTEELVKIENRRERRERENAERLERIARRLEEREPETVGAS